MDISNLTTSQEEQLLSKKIYTGVDATKYIMAILVVLIHVSAIMNVAPPAPVIWLMRLAVPFFFISSGWFLSKKLCGNDLETQKNILLHRTIALIRLFFSWVIIYFPISIMVFLDKSHRENFIYLLFRCIRRTIITGQPPFAWPLWFLHALIIGCFILFLLIKWPKLTKVVMLIFIINIFIFWLHNIQHIIPSILSPLFQISALEGIGLFYSGILLQQNCNLIFRINQVLLISITTVISLILFVFNLPYWALFGGIAMFLLSLKINEIPLSFATYLRNQSMWIYYVHMYVLYTLFYVFNANYNNDQRSLALLFIISTIITLLISNTLAWLNTTKLHRFLNPLIK